MYYSELPDCIKYKELRGPPSILEKIINRHNEKVKEWGTNIDYIIYKDDIGYILLLEKTQEEIVNEIKDWVLQNLNKLEIDINNKIYIKSSIALCKYVIDFERFSKYFTLSDIYPDCFYKPKQCITYTNTGQEILPDIDTVKHIDILLVLEKLGIDYKRLGSNTYALYENGKWTDGWRVNTNQNIVKDFACKGRAEGNPLNFVIEYYNLSVKDALLWFKENLC